MMELLSHYLKSTAAGSFLVIGCSALLASANIYLGAAVFVVALCSICNLGLPLFTGAVGYARSLKDCGRLVVALLGNMTGCAALGYVTGIALPDISAAANTLSVNRVHPIHIAFILSFVCGILMYTAVYTFRTKKSYIGILTCVPAFIIAGFEHSIAYMGFMGLGHTLTMPVFINMMMFVIGNGVGAVTLSLIMQLGTKPDSKHEQTN